MVGADRTRKPAATPEHSSRRAYYARDLDRSACSVIAREGSDLRRCIFAQIKQRLVHIAPPPSLGRIISLDDRMPCSSEMLGRMLTG